MPSIEFPAGLGERSVALRPLEEGDAAAFAQAFRDDPELGRLLGLVEDPSEQWAREAARRSRESAQEGRMIALAITGAEGDAFRGEVVLNRFDWKHRRCELGYWLVPRARGRGVATAALSLAVGWLFDGLELLRVEIATTTENVASQDLAQRLGFTREAVQRERDIERGHRVDVVQYGLLREEFSRVGS